MSKKTPADPTGLESQRKKMAREINIRLSKVEKQVKTMFRRIPKERSRVTVITNSEQTVTYSYQITDQELEEMEALIAFILAQELLQTQTGIRPPNWYLNKNIEQVYRQGTLEEVRDFNQMINQAARDGRTINGLPPQQVDSQQVVFSQPYQIQVNRAQGDAFLSVKGLSDTTSAQVMQVIRSGIRGGNSPIEVSKQITERFDVSKSRAETIARTEINKSYNDAKMDGTRILADRSGLRSGVIHVSALSTTTRQSHAARHGNVYTVPDQQSWWEQGANRINCKCTVRSVLIDKQGNVVQKDVLERFREEKKFFDPE